MTNEKKDNSDFDFEHISIDKKFIQKKELPLDIALFHNTFIIKNEKKIIHVICEKLN